jgi:Recombination endonuclease VII
MHAGEVLRKTRICAKCGDQFTTSPRSGVAYCKPCFSAYRKARYPLYRLSAEEKRSQNYRQNYGITEEDYQRMFEQQGGVCAACGQPPTPQQVGRARRVMTVLHVDHDHTTGEVRALLCSGCNSAMGMLKDDLYRMQALLAYRLRWK